MKNPWLDSIILSSLTVLVSCSHHGFRSDRRQPSSVQTKNIEMNGSPRKWDGPIVEIAVNVSYSAESAWTSTEIQDRFRTTGTVVGESCPGIKIVLDELIRVEDKDLQDLDGSLTPESVMQMNQIRSRFKKASQPTIFYVRRGKWPVASNLQGKNEFTEEIAKAYALGGPRSLPEFESYQWNNPKIKADSITGWEMGSLDWSRLDEFRSLHGVVIIGEGNSGNSPLSRSRNTSVSVDRHELGHILLNDGSHRNAPQNVMSGVDQNILDPDQCDLIRAYPRMESLRDHAIQRGMHQLCTLYDKYGVPNKPTYCR